MASKSCLYAMFFIVLLHLQSLYAIQSTLEKCPNPPHISVFEPRRRSHQVDIEVDKITKALWDAGYKIMSLVLEKKLRSIIPYADLEYANNTITIFNNNKITIFVPRDEAVVFNRASSHRYTDWRSLEYQFVTSKVDKEVPASSQLLTLHPEYTLVVRRHRDSEWPSSINDARILHWNIYDDGCVSVHGVSNFFHYLSNFRFPVVFY